MKGFGRNAEEHPSMPGAADSYQEVRVFTYVYLILPAG
jgi:hypothetical protein